MNELLLLVLTTGILLATSIVHARKTETRACRANGHINYFFWELNIQNEVVGGFHKQINILESDWTVVYVGSSSHLNRVSRLKEAKERACAAAAQAYVGYSPGSANIRLETFKKPGDRESWVKSIGCAHARAGNVPGLQREKKNKATIYSMEVVAVAERDGISKTSTKKYVYSQPSKQPTCWNPSTGVRTNPAPTRDN